MELQIHLDSYENSWTSSISIFFNVGAENEFLSSFTQEIDPIAEFNILSDMINTDNVWFYEGSMTKPPCTEGRRWVIFKDMFEMADW